MMDGKFWRRSFANRENIKFLQRQDKMNRLAELAKRAERFTTVTKVDGLLVRVFRIQRDAFETIGSTDDN